MGRTGTPRAGAPAPTLCSPAAWAFLLLVGCRFLAPAGEGRELAWTWWQHVLGDGYVWALLVTAVTVAVALARAGSGPHELASRAEQREDALA